MEYFRSCGRGVFSHIPFSEIYERFKNGDKMKKETQQEIESICKAACQHMEYSCREGCECGYCRIRVLLYNEKQAVK